METAGDIRQAVEIISRELTIDASADPEVFLARLSGVISEMIDNQFSRLVLLLYRLDIDEEKLKEILLQHRADDSGNVISLLIFKRQLEKLKSRREFRRDEFIDESEKW